MSLIASPAKLPCYGCAADNHTLYMPTAHCHLCADLFCDAPQAAYWKQQELEELMTELLQQYPHGIPVRPNKLKPT